MAVSTHYRASLTFDLPTSTTNYKPLIPFKNRNSVYCDCVCKDRVDQCAAITPGYHYDIEPQYAVLHTATRDAYCNSLSPSTPPALNGYFAYVLGNASSVDESMCVYTLSSCIRTDIRFQVPSSIKKPNNCFLQDVMRIE
jgi:hypothetical protein